MVTATTGNMIFRGMRTGRILSPSIYISDVVAATVKFSMSGVAAATSESFLMIPNDDVYVLQDISTLLSPTVAVSITPLFNDVPSGLIIHDANTLSTLPTRSFPVFAVKGGTKYGMVQA